MLLWTIEIIIRFCGVPVAENETCLCMPYNISQLVILLITQYRNWPLCHRYADAASYRGDVCY